MPATVARLALLVAAGWAAGCAEAPAPEAPAPPAAEAALAPLDYVPSNAYLALLPDGEAKRRFILDCTGCHQFDAQTIASGDSLKSHEEWAAWTRQMLAFSGAETAFPVIAPSRDPEATADWLVTHLGDETDPLPEPALPPPAVSRADLEATEFDLPAPMDLPHDLALDPQGRVVITGQLSGAMYVLDPESGAFETVPIPVPNANPRALSLDADGTWWVLLGGPQQIARYHPDDGDWQTWPIGMHPHSIVRDDDGRLWYNGHFTKSPEQIGVLDPRTGATRTFDVPADPMPDGGTTMPYGLRQAPDGTLWGTQLIGGRLVRFDPQTEAFALYPLPTPYAGPRRPDVARDGTVWIPEYANNALARFDPRTEAFEEIPLPLPDALPYIVRVDDARGWVWIATAAADAVLRYFPAERRFDVFPLPTPRSLVRHMALDAETGALWLSYGNFPAVSPKVVRLVAN